MNKGITLLILVAVLGAMALVMYSHTRSAPPAPQPAAVTTVPESPGAGASSYQSAAQRNSASPLQAPQGDIGLRPIEPPLSGAGDAPAARQGDDGVPRSVTLTTPVDGRPARPPQTSGDGATAAVSAPSTSGQSPAASTPTPPAPEPASAQNGTARAPAATAPSGPDSTAAKPQVTESKPAVTPAASSTPPDKTAAASPTANSSSSGKAENARQSTAQTSGQTSGQTAAQAAQAPATQTPASKPSGSPGLTAGPTPWDTPQTTSQTSGQATGQASGQPASQPAGQTSGQTSGQSASSAAPEARASAQAAQTAVDPRSLSDKGTHALQNISLEVAGSGVRLRVEADSPFPYKAFALTGPDRLVIDLPGTWKGMKAPSVPGNSIVNNVRLGKHATGPRLVLDLSGAKKHAVERTGNAITITVQ